MASYKCKMCGAPLDVENGQTVATCNFCGSKQTVANADDERKENLFNRANALRINCEFDKAQLAYQSILSIFPTEPEAHWGVTLCKYGIEYVDDPATKKKKPTIHRMSFESILKDSDYLAALANADAIAKEQYQAEAKEIADIQKNILTISQKEEPFDIFICYKETNNQHKRTPDSVMAQEIYTTLTDKGYKVFFSRITLENKLGTMYEPYIFAALNSAKIMLVIGTKKEYFEAVWVKNEWSRFLSLMQTRPDHYLIPCYKDMNAYEMPEEFLSFQAQDLGKLGFMQDLTRGIDKIMGKDTQAVQQETRIIQTDVNVDALLTRAEILIGDKNYEKADELLEKVLNNDPKNSQAYLLKLVIELQLTSIDELKNEENTLEGKSNFQKAYDFGSAEQKARLNSINEYIENRNEEARLSRLYDIAMDYKNEGKYTEAEQAFSEIAGFRDATAQAAECVKLDKEGIYKRAVTYKESKNYDDAIATFEKINDFSDSEKQIAECKELKKSDIYKQALALKEEGKFDEASALFMTILNYNDSDFQVNECERLKTEAQKEAVYASCVIREEINLYFHANQLKQACKKLATIPGYKDADQLLVKYEGILKDYERELQVKKEEKARVRAKKMKKFKWISIFSSIGALIITGVLLLTSLYLVPENRQNNMQALIDAGKYDEAIALVGENGGYGDSQNLIQMAKAGQAFEALDYETGIDYIYNIGGAVDVNYDAKGGAPEKTGETIKRRKYIDNDSEKDGYTFHGWKLSEYSIKSANHYAAITLDAQYETITYTLEFDLKGGTCSSLPTTYNTEESVAIPNPTRKGYTFTGWTGIGLSEPQIDYVLPVGSIGNKKFTATWSANHYQIHLDTNGGTVSKDVVDVVVDVVFDSYYTLPTPSFDGYTFKGWFDSSSVQYSSGTYTLDRDLYLTARWEAIVYTITYNLNGGTNNPANPTTYKVNDSNHVLQDPSRVGYTFLGWTTSSISTPTKDITISTGTFGNLTFTANWSANKYNVTVLLNGGEASKTSYEVTYDSLYSIEEPTRVGYGFTGFVDTNNNALASSGIWKVDGDVTLTATWSANTNTPYKVKHYLENIAGTDYVLDDTETKYGTSDSMVTVYSKNYTGFTPKVVSKETKLLPDGSLVVELYYTRNSYTLNFITNGGSNVSSTTLKYQESIPTTTVTSRSGYTFNGWYYDIQQMNPFEGMPAQDASAYAYYSEETRANYFDFTYSGGEAKITRGKQLSGAVVVPFYINDKLVTEIGEGAFEDCDAITSIDLPEYVDTLGARAFKGCTALERITGTENLTIIEDSTFEGCRSLSVFPDLSNFVSIGNNAFKDCVSLTTITISDTLTSIGNYAFSGCVSLLQTPDLSNVVSIGDYAFEGCRLLTEIKGLDGCATIGEGIFTACENIAKLTLVFKDTVEQFYIAKFFCGSDALGDEKYYQVEIDNTLYYIPKALQEVEYTGTESIPEYFLYELSSIRTFKDKSNLTSEIGAHAFDGCSALETFTMSHPSVSSIGAYAFNGCSSIASLPNMSPETIGNYALSGCVSLLQTPDLSNVVSIGDYAFEGVNVFTNLTLPDSLLSLGEGAFSGCSSITTLSLPFTASSRTDLGDFGYIFGNKNYSGSYLATQNAGSYYIPGGLTTLTIRNGVIGEESIANVSSLANVTIGNNVTSIGPSALKGCSSIVNLSVPFVGAGEYSAIGRPINYSVANSGSYGWELVDGIYRSTNYHVSSSTATMIVTFENSGTFTFKYKVSSQSSYDKLTITHNSTTLVNGISGNGSYIERTITVAKNDKLTLSYYKNASTNSNDDRSYFQVVSSHTTDPMPETLGHIFGTESYSGSYVAENYYIPSTLTNVSITAQEEIPAAAFKNCTSLTTVNIPTTTTSIGESAFYHCTSLVSLNGTNVINIPNAVETIGNDAFFENTSATSLSIGSSVTSIGTYAFASNSSLMIVAVADGSALTTINNYAFSNCSSLTQFSFDGTTSLSSIGEGAFLSNTSLNKWGTNSNNTISIPSGVTSIGQQAFANETGITSVVIPASVTSVGEGSFRGCNALINITMPKVYGNKLGHIFGTESYSGSYVAENYYIPSTLTNVSITAQEEIPAAAFKNCTSLTTVNIPTTTTSIGESAFYHCTSLVSLNGTNVINIPNAVETIGNDAFFENTSATSLSIGSSVTSIGTYAFASNSSLMIVAVADGSALTTINNYAFSNCSSLTQFSFDGTTSLSSIGEGAFLSNTSLNKWGTNSNNTISIPSGVTSIGQQAFANETGITSVVIPASVTSVGEGSFRGCNALINITMPKVYGNKLGHIFGTESYSGSYVAENYYIPSTLTNVSITAQEEIPAAAFKNCTSLTTVNIPTTTTSIGESAFYHCTSLVSLNGTNVINIPNAVTRIENNTFALDTSIAAVTMGNNVTYLGESAFEGTTALANIQLSSSLETIDNRAFIGDVTLTTITIPDSVLDIGNYAFQGCSNLTTVTCEGTSSITLIGNNVFEDCSSLLEVPNLPNVQSIGDSAFANCVLLTDLSGLANLVSIGNYAFDGCSSLADITDLAVLQSIGNYAFRNCSSLVDVELPTSLETIGSYAFAQCTGLTNVHSFANVTSIGEYAFYNDSALLTLPASSAIETIGDYAFYNCSSLLVIPSYTTLTSIGNYAFANDNLITTIGSLSSLTSIGNHAFYNCASLVAVNFGADCTIGEAAFAKCVSLESASVAFDSAHDFYYYFGSTESFEGALTRTNGSSNTYYVPAGLVSFELKSLNGSLAASALYNCSQFTTLLLDETITSIGANGFYNCSGLTSLTIPDEVTTVGTNILYGCYNLTELKVPFVGTTPTSGADFGVIFGTSSYSNSYSAVQRTGTYYIPSSLVKLTIGRGTINSNACANMDVITDLVIADSVTTIGKGAFTGCSSLVNLTMPKIYGDSTVGYTATGSFSHSSSSTSFSINKSGSGNNGTYTETVTFTTAGVISFSGSTTAGSYVTTSSLSYKFNGSSVSAGTRRVNKGDTLTISYTFSCSTSSSITSSTGTASVTVTNAKGGELGFIFGNDSYSGSYADSTGALKYYIPSALRNVRITTQEDIPAYAFSGCTAITSISIPNTSTSIGDYAFYNCSALTSLNGTGEINVPETVETIGIYAFAECKAITKVSIGGGTETIKDNAFQNCSLLNTLVLSEGLESIGMWAFDGNISLLSLNIPSTVTSIGRSSFRGNSSLTTVHVADESLLETINPYAFQSCTSLTEFIFDGSSSLVTIGEGAFLDSSLITKWGTDEASKITIPNGVTTIDTEAFGNLSLITDLVIADSVTTIGKGAFTGCSSLVNLTMPKIYGDSTVGYTATGSFSHSSSSTSFSINKSGSGNNGTYTETVTFTTAGVISFSGSTTAGSYVTTSSLSYKFNGSSVSAGTRRVNKGDTLTISYTFSCSTSSSITSSTGTASVTVTNAKGGELGFIFGNDSYSGSYADSTGALKYYIPSALRNVRITTQEDIPAYAFSGCTAITSISIPNTSTSIGDYAFYNCSALTSLNGTGEINVPETVETIGIYAFAECKAITKVSIGGGTETIKDNAFQNCSLLNTLVLSEGLESIGMWAFDGNISLLSLNIPSTVTSIGRSSFRGNSSLTTVHVADESLLETINPYAFQSCTSLTEFIFDGSSSLVTIGEGAFLDSSLITKWGTDEASKITIPNGVTTIDTEAFGNLSLITDLVIADSVTTIGKGAFTGCSSLVNLTMPKIYGDSTVGYTATGSFSHSSSSTSFSINKSGSGNNGTYTETVTFTTAGVISFSGSTTAGSYVTTSSLSYKFNGSSVSAGTRRVNKGDTLTISYTFSCSTSSSITSSTGTASVTVTNAKGGELGFIFGNDSYSGSYADSTGALKYYIPSALRNVRITTQEDIPAYAFSGCTAITSISIPNTSTSIGDYAFYNCSALTSLNGTGEINVPETVETIGIYAFAECKAITKVSIGGGTETIKDNAFQNCSLLNTLVLSEGLESIGMWAFDGNISLLSLNIPSTVTSIGRSSFRGNSSLTTVHVADESLLETINPYAFQSCTSLTEFIFDGSSSLVTIGEGAFLDSSLITKWGTDEASKITIPNGVTTIDTEAFGNLSLITDLVIADSVTTIGKGAFTGCSSLVNLTMPKIYGDSTVGYTATGSFSHSSSSTSFSINKSGSGNNGTYTETVTFTTAGVISFSGSTTAGSYVTTSSLSYKFNGSSVSAGTRRVNKGDTLTISYTFSCSTSSSSASYTGTASVTVTNAKGGELGFIFGNDSYSGSYADSTGALKYYIPSALRNVRITTQEDIPAYAFSGCTAITSISIPNTSTSIGDYAFYNCSALTSLNGTGEINVPETVETIGIYAFAECKAITKVSIGGGTETIKDNAFQNCSLLNTLVLSEGLESIGMWAFDGNISLLSLNIPSTVTSIGRSSFRGNSSLTTVHVADESLLETINPYAFQSCTSLTEFIFDGSSSLVTIGEGAFLDSSLITKWGTDEASKITIPNGVTTIDTEAFGNLSLITDLVIADSVTTIGKGAFTGCSSLVNLTMPKIYGDSTVGYTATGSFSHSSSSTSFSINKSGSGNNGTYTETVTFTTAGVISFSGSTTAGSYVTTSSLSYKFNGSSVSAGTRRVNKGDTLTISYTFSCSTSSSSASYTGTASVTVTNAKGGELGFIFGNDSYSGSYADSTGALKYYIPSALRNVRITTQEDIPAYAFSGCTAITSISIPNTSTSIGDYAFYNCSALTSLNGTGEINVPETVETIGIYAFAECKAITKVSIGGGTETIGNYAFYNCTALTDLSLAEGVKSIGNYAFANCTLLARINSNVVGEANFPDSLETVEQNAFLNCDLLTNIVFGSSISSLQSNAFKGCSNINKLILSVNGNGWSGGFSLTLAFPDSIANITEIIVSDGDNLPDNIFKDMTSVEKITLPEDLITIGTSSFSGCTSLTKINSNTVGEAILPDTITSIGDSAFQGCTGFTHFDLGESLLTTGTNSFEGCTSLVRIDIPETVISIGKYSFKNCSNVQYFNSDIAGVLNVPSSCTTLVEYCFEGMDKITTVNIGDKVTSIGVGILLDANHVENITLPFVGSSIKADDSSYLSKFGMIFGYTTTNTSTTELSGAIYSGLTISSKKYWFYVPTSLDNVTVTVQTQVPSYAFYNCDMLSSIVMPQSVTTIGSEAFTNCSATVQYTYSPTISSPWDGSTVATSFHSGNGTEDNPYVIFDGNELAYLASQVNSGVSYANTYFTLTCDIDLNDYAFVTIGDDAHPFLGNINGYGHSIQNYTITGSSTYVGLFGYFGGSLEHVGFFNGTITSTVSGNANYYAGLIAYMTETGSISNVYTNSKVFISGAYYIYAGGLVGYMHGGSITNSWSSRDVSATNANLFAYAGGIAGYINAGTISGCYSSGAITANGSALSYSKNGQIIGEKSDNAVISNCYKSGTTLTRYGTTDSVYNEDGTSGTAAECISALRTIWDNSKWILNDGNWPKLRVL